MLAPRKVKHRKWHKIAGTSGHVASRTTKIAFGDFGLKAETGNWMRAREIEAARRVLVRYIRKGGKIWIRVFPDKPVTMKGAETPMGKGKGSVDHYVAVIKPGQVLFEMSGIPEATAREALVMAGYKLSVRSKFIIK
jgi:large subunit ribosomal protein L16